MKQIIKMITQINLNTIWHDIDFWILTCQLFNSLSQLWHSFDQWDHITLNGYEYFKKYLIREFVKLLSRTENLLKLEYPIYPLQSKFYLLYLIQVESFENSKFSVPRVLFIKKLTEGIEERILSIPKLFFSTFFWKELPYFYLACGRLKSWPNFFK